ncbi:MAG: hypothetical protein HOQ24_02165 [Mycobacteriaceae bacterium]|nr:hypothetical protein [Mycobacteriaceae bacterium]
MALSDNPLLGAAVSFALPALGGLFKNPVYGAVGGLIGGAAFGLMNNHRGWNLVADIALGGLGGGLGASFGRKSAQALMIEGKSGATIGEALKQFTTGERALTRITSMAGAGAGAGLPILGKELVVGPSAVALPTTNIGRGD